MNDSSKINSSKPILKVKGQSNYVKRRSILSKISCKIAGHLSYASLNTGSSVSIASSDLYKKLLQDNCSFKEQNGALHLIDGVVPRQNYSVTSTTVSVIGKTKSINLLAFPNLHIEQTTLGMDFLSPKLKTNPSPRVKFPSNRNQSRNNNDRESIDKTIQFFDSFLNIPLETPIYDILTQKIATDKDIQTICTYMKNHMEHSKPLSPIKQPL